MTDALDSVTTESMQSTPLEICDVQIAESSPVQSSGAIPPPLLPPPSLTKEISRPLDSVTLHATLPPSPSPAPDTMASPPPSLQSPDVNTPSSPEDCLLSLVTSSTHPPSDPPTPTSNVSEQHVPSPSPTSPAPTTPIVLSPSLAQSTFQQRFQTSSTLSQLASMAIITHLQKQLISATLTISSMQQDIQTLKTELAHTTQRVEQNSQNTTDVEVRAKNSVKSFNQDFSQQIQQVHNDNTQLQCQLKDTTNKLQSFKDSQNNINTDLKKQMQTLKTVKHTQHSDSQTDQTHVDTSTTSSTQVAYCVKTSNRYSVLSDSSTDQNTCSSDTSTQTVHNMSNEHPNTTTEASTAINKQTTAPSPPLTILLQKSIPRNCNALLLGDSVLAGVDEKQMSSKGYRVKNLSVSGLTVHHLCQWLTSRPPSPHIQQVTFHVGINSCDKGPVSVADWITLIRLLRRVFPSAALQASSILPPIGQHPLKEAASRSTANLRVSCHQEGASYIDNTPSFLAKSGAPKKVMYRDRLHPSKHGYKVLAINICLSHNHKTQPINYNQPTPEWRRDRGVSEDAPVSTNCSPCFEYQTDFPTNTPQNPNSHKVFNVLGRHQRPHKQPLLRSPHQLYPLSSPDTQQDWRYRNRNYAISPLAPSTSPSSMPQQHTTNITHTRPPNTSQLPLPSATQQPPHNISNIPPPLNTNQLPPLNTTPLPLPNPLHFRPPNITHLPLQSVQTTSPLHPLAIQWLNTMTAQLLSQQHPSTPLSMPSLY